MPFPLLAMAAKAAMAKKSENDAGSQAGAAQAMQGASPNQVDFGQPAAAPAAAAGTQAPTPAGAPASAQANASDGMLNAGAAPAAAPGAGQMAGFLGLSPDTWRTIGQAGQVIGAARGDGAQMSALPGTPNLGVSFSSPAMPQQYAQMQAPQFSATQAPQFPYIGVPGGNR